MGGYKPTYRIIEDICVYIYICICIYIIRYLKVSISTLGAPLHGMFGAPRQAAKDVQTAWDLEPSDKIGPGRKQSRFLARDLPK